MFSLFRNMTRRWLDKWLFKLGDAESGEVFLSQRRVFIVPGKPGLVFGATLLVLFIGAINYNLSLGFALIFLLASCAVIDMHLTFRNLAYLYLAAGRAHAVFAGEDAQFELYLINRRKYDRYAIRVGFVDEAGVAITHPVDVAANTTKSLMLAVTTGVRGVHPAPRVRLETRFPLGLLRAWSYWQPDAKVVVYPHPEDNAPPLPTGGDMKEGGQGSAGHDDFSGIRAYQAGDSWKHLAWRQIARMDVELGGTLVTKQFEGGASGNLTLDFAVLPPLMDIEIKLSRMTRWVIEAEVLGLPYAFRLGAMTLPAALGPEHQAACLHALALYRCA
jgi:uncharacterized protein (DUF58 family)